MENEAPLNKISSNLMLYEVLCDGKQSPHLKYINNLIEDKFHKVSISQSENEYQLKFRTLDDCVASELAMKNNGEWLDCYSYRILVRKNFISCFVGQFVSDDELPKPTYEAIEHLSQQTGDFAKDFMTSMKDSGSIYAEALRNSIIERFGNTIAYLNESIIATDMRIAKYLLDNGLTEAKHFI